MGFGLARQWKALWILSGPLPRVGPSPPEAFYPDPTKPLPQAGRMQLGSTGKFGHKTRRCVLLMFDISGQNMNDQFFGQ